MDTRDKADLIIREHIVWSVGAGLVPIPLIDIAAVTAIQLDMLKQLATHYGVSYSESEGKAWISALAGSLVARLGANALKLIPGIGSFVGGVSMSILSGASTYAVGQVAVSHFSTGGSFSNLDYHAARKTYEDELERGKEMASKLSKEKGATRDNFEKLERLAALRDKGIVTAEEFEAQKKKILDTL